jgi:hypothetical protein
VAHKIDPILATAKKPFPSPLLKLLSKSKIKQLEEEIDIPLGPLYSVGYGGKLIS